jgi:hypothetical protein
MKRVATFFVMEVKPMELLWEYTFPVISLGSHVTLQKGTDNLVGVAIADYPDMPPSIPFILIGARKMFSLPPSARTRRTSFFEMDLKRKQAIISSMHVSHVSSNPFHLIYDQERTIWWSELERQFPGSKGYDGLEIYEIHPEEDPQWIRRVSIDGKQVDLGDKECIALWKTGQRVHCLFRIPDIGESDDDQVFWATWSLQTADSQEKIQQIGYADAITVHITEQGCLLFLYQRLLDRVETPFSDRTGSGKWQLSSMAYDNTGHLVHQEVIPQLTTHIRDLKLPDHDLFEAFFLQVVVGDGPLYGSEQQSTCVAVAMRKEKTAHLSSEEQESVEAENKRTEGLQELQHQIGRLLWIDLQGHILSAEDGRIGEQLTLCCCGNTIIGADLLEGRWRLWHWIPAAGTGIHIGTSFPADVIKISILAEEPRAGENGRSFWCLEQYQQGLRVVQRDCEQRNERTAIWCEGFTLLCDWTGIRMEKCQGVVLSEGRLVLLGRDQDEKIKLVCIQ